MNRIEPHIASFGATDRRDAWWIEPLLTALVLIGFVLYASFAGMSNAHYEFGGYLSPFYSPLLPTGWLPDAIEPYVSPAALILVFPAGFRATCYYYRKAYYRSFFFHPPGCAVGEGRAHKYSGERAFPWVLQNMHRFFLYAALVFIAILSYDVWLAMWFPFDAAGAFVWAPHHAHDPITWKFGIGLGTLVMAANVVLLSAYTLGCHSLRHLVGGKHDCFNCLVSGGPQEPLSYKAWKGVSFLNKRHQNFAWFSLFSVGLTDLYIRLCSMGYLTDLRILFN